MGLNFYTLRELIDTRITNTHNNNCDGMSKDNTSNYHKYFT